MQNFIYAILGIISVTLFSGSAFACSCMRAESAADQMASADIVFEGRVINVKQEREYRSFFHRIQTWFGFNDDFIFTEETTTFEVVRTVKGESGPTVKFRHTPGSQGSMCGVSFPKETDVLIIGYQDDDGLYSTSLCTLPQFPIEDFVAAKRADAE